MKRTFVCFIILLEALAAVSQQTKSPARLALDAEINALKKDAGLKHASWSVYVYNITDAKVEAEHNSQISLIPASIQKTITTATALHYLGSDYRFTTTLAYTGHIDTTTGILNGDLIIIGAGDPTLGSKRFGKATDPDSILAKFVRAVTNAGIRQIDGNVFGDERIFDDLIPQSWSYEDVGNYYASTISGLSFRENQYRLYFNAGAKLGDSARLVKMDPQLDITFVNRVMTGPSNSGDQVFILGSPYTNFRILDGTMPLGKKNFDVDGAMPDPGLFCVQQLFERLKISGVSISGTASTYRNELWNGRPYRPDSTAPITIMEHHSPSLKDIIWQTNQWSVNLYAEALLKLLGTVQGGYGSTQMGLEVVRNYWASNGIDLKGFEMNDGSGLSRKNRFTAQQLGKILTVFSNDKAFEVFMESLPMAGEKGMMSGYLKGTVAEKNLVAKSGVLEGVRTYAGYVTSVGGDRITFVIMVNNYTCSPWELRTKCEGLMGKVAGID